MDNFQIVYIVLIDVAAVVLYILLLTRLDRHRVDKQSTDRILQFYILGLLSIIPVSILYLFGLPIEYIMMTGNYYVDSAVENFLFVGPIEEFSKFIIFLLFSLRLRSIIEPGDGILQAAAVALAFASLENLKYGSIYGVELMLKRSVLSIIGHMVYSSIWACAFSIVVYGQLKKEGKLRLKIALYAVLPAAFIHGLYNFLLDLDLMELAIVLDILVLLVAIVIYRIMIEESPYKKMPMAEYKIAIRRIRRGLEVHPRSYLLNRRMAIYQLYGGNYAAALKYFKQCVLLKPLNRFMKCFKGFALMLTGDMSKGRRHFREAFAYLGSIGRAKVKRMVKRCLVDSGAKQILLQELLLCETQARSFGRETTARMGKREKSRTRAATQVVYRSRAVNRAGRSYSNILQERSRELREALKQAG